MAGPNSSSDHEDDNNSGARRKYIPLSDLYSRSRRPKLTTVTQVYSRKRTRVDENGVFLRSLALAADQDELNQLEDILVSSNRRIDPTSQLLKLGLDFTKLNNKGKKAKLNFKKPASAAKTTWLRLSFDGVDPTKFIGLKCKVFWPLDADWYSGRVVGYDSKTRRHHVLYDDKDEEDRLLSNERIKFYLSYEEMQTLDLKVCNKASEPDGIDVNEMMALAATLDDSSEVEHGDVIWAKLTGHAIWPAVVLDDSRVAKRKGLDKVSGEKSILVQFFGTHDFARVTRKQVIPFLEGFISSCHLKCKKPSFLQGLEEARMSGVKDSVNVRKDYLIRKYWKLLDIGPSLSNLTVKSLRYLSEGKVPNRMVELRDDVKTNSNNNGSREYEDGADLDDEESLGCDDIAAKLEDLKNCPLEAGELQLISLGKIVKDSTKFQNEKFIWPAGYTALRKFPSVTDPSVDALYKMEILRDANCRTRPLFKVTAINGEEFNGPTPSACWNKIYQRITTVQTSNSDCKADRSFPSGSSLFGFSHPKVSKLIQEMSNSKRLSRSSNLASKRPKYSSVYRAVHVEWRDLDKCNVCHMDEEYENNLFLQCDKCRMMVHARCYGELEPTGGALWLCQLCRPGAPKSPTCCLCPVVGGAMKPTTDGRWAHLTCAIWIPETCLSDIKKMEPIDGLRRVNKDRWKLLCSICGVPYGACIQCSNGACRVAYHPLCARVAGFCLEHEDADKSHLVPFDEDGEDQCIQLLSFCKKHRPSLSHERLSCDQRIGQPDACKPADYVPKVNPSGCARTEPYDFSRKRGKNESEVLTTALSKRMYVENMPYLVGGCSPHTSLWNKKSSSSSIDLQKLRYNQLDDTKSKILSLADKYNYMKDTLRRRLVFGKSAIHGYGVFTKLPHRAGDMVIEYAGEVIRPRVADRREHLIYNSLVGAGTYMFRVDDERVIDATRAGSIAHLINHSCDPNCYSRAISINGEDHIIIFSKREIKEWEELTYDYRFVSSDQQLPCYCGSSRCRGVVNDVEAEERMKKLCVPQSELIEWTGEA